MPQEPRRRRSWGGGDNIYIYIFKYKQTFRYMQLFSNSVDIHEQLRMEHIEICRGRESTCVCVSYAYFAHSGQNLALSM